ncbi:MAG TPA: hypothetical protein VGB39_01415, partial [Sphingomicrobium sp.]
QQLETDGEQQQQADEAATPSLEGEPEQMTEAVGEKRPRRRRGRKPAADAVTAGPADVEPDSSPMVERPLAEEPAIAETAPQDELFVQPEAAAEDADGPRARRRPRARKAATAKSPAAKSELVAEPAPEPEPEPTKPARKRRTKTAESADAAVIETASAPTEAAAARAKPVPTPDNDSAMPEMGGSSDGEARRGWWQRTFG